METSRDFHWLERQVRDKLLRATIKTPFKAGQRCPRQVATDLLKELRPLFSTHRPPSNVETHHTLYSPRVVSWHLPGLSSHPRNPGSQTHRVCPHTFTISFNEGFRYLVVLHLGQPWSSMASPLFRLFPDAGFSHCHHKQPQTRRQAGSYQQALGRNGPSRKSTGWKRGAATQRFRERVLWFRRYSSIITLGEPGQYIGMGEGMLLSYTPLPNYILHGTIWYKENKFVCGLETSTWFQRFMLMYSQ